MSINSINNILGMSYPYLNPYMNQMQGTYLSNYGLTNSLYGVGYGNLLQTTSIDNAESFAKVLEKISEGGTGGKETKAIAQKTETDKGENVQNSIPMTMVSRNVPRIQVVNGMKSLQVKKINPYVTVAYKKI